MKLLSDLLNIMPNKIVAVSNGENDYPMFEYASFSVGINVPDIQKVNINFETISEAI